MALRHKNAVLASGTDMTVHRSCGRSWPRVAIYPYNPLQTVDCDLFGGEPNTTH